MVICVGIIINAPFSSRIYVGFKFKTIQEECVRTIEIPFVAGFIIAIVSKRKNVRGLLFFYQNKQAIKRESTTSQQYANNNSLYHTKIVYTERQLMYIPAMLGAGISITEF